MGSVWGKNIKISLFGQSHGASVGVVIDGFPSGILYEEGFISDMLGRRAPQKSTFSTSRSECDIPKILSGTYKGFTSGQPICAVFDNNDTRPESYLKNIDTPRPSHADLTGYVRYGGFNDPRGGGHFSGRLTAPMVFTGALCKLFLMSKGIYVKAHIDTIGCISDTRFDQLTAYQTPTFSEGLTLINSGIKGKMIDFLKNVADNKNSVGGVVECACVGLKSGIGGHIFDNIEASISSILFSIPAVKGVEFGKGFTLSLMDGLAANDCLWKDESGNISYKTNNSGGVLGGISTGMPIIVRAAFKPVPSIAAPQCTLNIPSGKEEKLEIFGRHDVCLVPRAVCVVEAAVCISVLDLYLEAYGYEFDGKFAP